MLWWWLTADFIALINFILSIAHVSNWITLIRCCCCCDWHVFSDQLFRRWNHHFKSFVCEIRLIFLSGVFEAKLLLRLGHFTILAWHLWFWRHAISLCCWLSSSIQWCDCLLARFFLHKLLEKFAVFELSYIRYLLWFLVLLICLWCLLVMYIACRLNWLKLNFRL